MRETAGRPTFSWRQRMLVIVLGVLIVALQVTIVETYQNLGRSIRWFAGATENTTDLYNTHREALQLELAVERLVLPEGLDEVELHRALLNRQLQVGLGVSNDPQEQDGLAQINEHLAAFDAEWVKLRARPTAQQLATSRPIMRVHTDKVEKLIKSIYDRSEIQFMGSIVKVMDARTDFQRLLLGMSGITLAVGLVLAVSLRRRTNRAHARAYARMVAEVDERKRLAEKLQHQAFHDPLTGLPNRALLRERAIRAIGEADQEVTSTALALIDLDRFKEVNDTLGHHYGDQLLIQVGQRLAAALRTGDTVARLGGDEFAVVLPGIDTAEAAIALAKKLQAAYARPFMLEGLTLDIEASIGVALYPEHANDPEELLRHADIAMYAAKQNHVGFMLFDHAQDQHSPRRLALLGELRRAIERHQLLLHYQPKVDVHTGRVLGVEALVRWDHPERGLVLPTEFIPLAEPTGLISPLTHYVLDVALRQCRQWRQAGHELSVAVNVSVRRLLDLDFPAEVATLLGRYQVPPQLLVLEITESTIMADPAHALQVLRQLNGMGVQLSIDDFGTGYSSMAYLKTLPVQELKVDRSFVSQMTTNTSDTVIVRSTIDLGRNLGLRVVAEGVEDLMTWQELSVLGCDAIQGYYVSPAVVPDQLISWLLRQPTAIPNRQIPARRPGDSGSRAVPLQGADLTDAKPQTRVTAD
jgi:diguanylate cyclase (GGDEF)-like protein